LARQVTKFFPGFESFKSNVTFVPIQFFTVVIPKRSRGTVRLVGYVLRKVLGWVDQNGNPTQEQLRFTYGQLVRESGVSRNKIGAALDEAVQFNLLHCVRPAHRHLAGEPSQSAIYELVWDPEPRCTHEPVTFQGFCYPAAVVVEEHDGARTVSRPKVCRKNIPNAFFDVLIPRERLSVIRVVGALLFYSIQWGPAGERKVPVSRSITELSRLTRFSRHHVHAAVTEARRRGYIEQVDAGRFDLAAGQESRPATYGIRWATSAPRVEATTERQRPNKVKVTTAQNGERGRPNKVNGEQPKMVNDINIKTEHKTLKTTASAPLEEAVVGSMAAAANPGFDLLRKAGFDEPTARYLAGKHPLGVIQRQIEYLPLRTTTKNRLGFLRRAIEQDWPRPEGAKTIAAAEGAYLDQAKVFASHYYAGYHGFAGEAATEPFPKDIECAAKFLVRLKRQEGDRTGVSDWGRRFGRLMRQKHQNDPRAKPNLCFTLVLFGDAFLRQLEQEGAARRKETLGKARAAHEAAFSPDYLAYLGQAEKALQRANLDLYQSFTTDRQRLRHLLFSGSFMTSAARQEAFDSESSRLYAFAEFFARHAQHRVLSFWDWDSRMNPRHLDNHQSGSNAAPEARP